MRNWTLPGLIVFCLLLSVASSGQVLKLGPLNAPPIDPSLCSVDPGGQTELCFTSQGIEISIAGQPFIVLPQAGPPGPEGPPGTNATLIGQTCHFTIKDFTQDGAGNAAGTLTIVSCP
jgi:hypothetical protein